MNLADVFQQVCRSFDPTLAPALEELLQALYVTARRAHPDVGCSPQELARYIAERVPADTPVLAFVRRLHAADVFLACGCVLGTRGAAEIVERELLPQLPRVIARVTHEDLFEEVLQTVRERLLWRREGSPPGIARYSGQGALLSWLRMVATRVAMDVNKAHRRRRAREQDVETVAAATFVSRDPELLAMRGELGQRFAEAFRHAFHALPEDARNVLSLQVLDGLNIDEIAAFWRIGRSTAARWLVSARKSLLEGTRARLKETLSIESVELDSLMRAARSDLYVSVERLLREQRERTEPTSVSEQEPR
jgi:RNA polymerase sigma-70 factor (ECF subfamily)